MKSVVFLVAMLLGGMAWGVAIPPSVQKLIEDNLPLSFYATPRSTRATKVYPLESMQKRVYKKTMSVNIAEDPLVLIEFSADKKVVNVGYPVGTKGDYLTGWFKVEDVLDLGQLKLNSPVGYAAPTGTVRHFLYQPRASGAPYLVGCIRSVEGAQKIGERRVKKGERGRQEDVYNLLFMTGNLGAIGEWQLASKLVLARDIPEFKEANYRDLIAQMGSEYAYRTGRFWDNSTHPIVVRNGNGGCAAFATDFAGYIFDAGNFNTGVRFTSADEIRAGDVIQLKGHYITVVERYPDGKLLTWDGNCNSSIRRTAGAYSIVNGELKGGAFVGGWHYMEHDVAPAVDPKKARKTKKR